MSKTYWKYPSKTEKKPHETRVKLLGSSSWHPKLVVLSGFLISCGTSLLKWETTTILSMNKWWFTIKCGGSQHGSPHFCSHPYWYRLAFVGSQAVTKNTKPMQAVGLRDILTAEAGMAKKAKNQIHACYDLQSSANSHQCVCYIVMFWEVLKLVGLLSQSEYAQVALCPSKLASNPVIAGLFSPIRMRGLAAMGHARFCNGNHGFLSWYSYQLVRAFLQKLLVLNQPDMFWCIATSKYSRQLDCPATCLICDHFVHVNRKGAGFCMPK